MSAMANFAFNIAVCLVILQLVQSTWVSPLKRHLEKTRYEKDAKVKTVYRRTVEGSLRLAGGVASSGRLEIYYEGSWMTICNYYFGQPAASVACTSLGFTGGSVGLQPSSSVYYEGSILPYQVDCDGDEAGLLECRNNELGDNVCSHWDVVFVDCFNSPGMDTEGTEGAIRLVGTATENRGRVEIYHDGEWGTICDDDFEDTAATVVCKSLGYFAGSEHPMAAFGRGSGSIWLDDVVCNGEETNILDCSHRPWGENNCDHVEDVGVKCYDDAGIDEGTIQLVGGPDDSAGRVEIFHSGEWGTVCDDRFDSNDAAASVVCRSMGYESGREAHYGQGQDPIWLDDVQCGGHEADLTECTHNPWGEHNCGHSEDVGVACE